jgi:hypothetical protein
VRHAAQLGALWGLGHTLTLLLAGGGVIVLRVLLSYEVPLWADQWTTRIVALMLIFLGAQAIRGAWQWKQSAGHICIHKHEATKGLVEHAHFHYHGEHECTNDGANSQNGHPSHRHTHGSFWVGMVHGLAGSAGLMLLVLAAIPHPLWALSFVGVFGVGSVSGMSAVTAGFAFSLQMSQRLSGVLPRVAQGIAGLASLVFGLDLLR